MSDPESLPSESRPRSPHPTPPQTLVLPQVSPPKPPRFATQTLGKRSIRAYTEDLREFQAFVRRYADAHEVPAATRKGGRPPIAAEAFRALLRTAQLLPVGPRASSRIRRADEAARVGFGRLYRRHGPLKALPYSVIEPVVASASGADRPLRRYQATAGFCHRRILAAFPLGAPRVGPAQAIQDVLPSLVPELAYGFGPIVYQSTLDEITA